MSRPPPIFFLQKFGFLQICPSLRCRSIKWNHDHIWREEREAKASSKSVRIWIIAKFSKGSSFYNIWTDNIWTGNIWTDHIWIRIFLPPRFFFPFFLFYLHFFFNPHFFLTPTFFTPHFFTPFFYPLFFTRTFFNLHFCFHPHFFLPPLFFYPHFFLPQLFFTPLYSEGHYFGGQYLVGPSVTPSSSRGVRQSLLD